MQVSCLVAYGNIHQSVTANSLTDAILTVLISTPVQIFVAWRLKIVSMSAIVPALITLLAFVSLGKHTQFVAVYETHIRSLVVTAAGGIKLGTSAAIHRDFAHFSTFKPTLVVWLASSAAADFLITSGLTWSLFTREKGMKETDDKVARILRCM